MNVKIKLKKPNNIKRIAAFPGRRNRGTEIPNHVSIPQMSKPNQPANKNPFRNAIGIAAKIYIIIIFFPFIVIIQYGEFKALALL